MKIFDLPRGSGKTTLLIIISHFTNARIITGTQSSANYVKMLAQEMNFNIPEPKNVLEYISLRRGRKPEKILIDELDIVLKLIFNSQEILAVTRTSKLKKEFL